MTRDELYTLVREHVEKNVVPQLSQPEPEIVKEGFFRDFFTAIAEASRRRKKFHDYAMTIGNYMLNRVRVDGGISLELIVSHFDVDNCTFQIGIGYDGEFKDEYGSTNYDENGAEQSSTYKLIKSEAKKAEKKEAVKSFREFEKKEGLFKETMKEYPNIEKIGYIDTDEIGVTIKESYIYQEGAVFDDIDKATYARLLKEVMMEQYGDIDSINESTGKTITAKFFDRGNINIVISNGVSHADMLPDNVNDLISSVIKTCCTNKALYDYLYTRNKSFFEDINEEPYLGGKTINCGKDLINAIETKYKFYCGAAMERSKDGKEVPVIFFNGEYWCEPEHGFSISFPNGKIVKSAEDDVTKSTFICGGAGDYIL